MEAILVYKNVSLLEPFINSSNRFLASKRSKTVALSRAVQSFFLRASLVRTWKQQCKYLPIYYF